MQGFVCLFSIVGVYDVTRTIYVVIIKKERFVCFCDYLDLGCVLVWCYLYCGVVVACVGVYCVVVTFIVYFGIGYCCLRAGCFRDWF